MAKTSAKKLASNKRWYEKNKDKQRRYSLKSSAKRFIKNYANNAELDEISMLLMKRREELR